jgi:hypothetical protein
LLSGCKNDELEHQSEKAQFLSDPFEIGRAVGACQAVGQIDQPSRGPDGIVFPSYVERDGPIAPIIQDPEFRLLVASSPSDYLRGIEDGKKRGNDGPDRASTEAWKICTLGHRDIAEWWSARALEKYRRAVAAREEQVALSPLKAENRDDD